MSIGGDGSDNNEFETVDSMMKRINNEDNLPIQEVANTSAQDIVKPSEEFQAEMDRLQDNGKGIVLPKSSRPIDGPNPTQSSSAINMEPNIKSSKIDK